MEQLNYLQKLFINCGLSLKELQYEMDISRSTLYRWFKDDDLDVSKAMLLIKAMGYDLENTENDKPLINKKKVDSLNICPFQHIRVLEKQILLLEKTLSTYEKHIGKIELD